MTSKTSLSKKHKRGKLSSSSVLKIPDFGIVDIQDYGEFLKKSKEQFNKKWYASFKLDKADGVGGRFPQFKDYQKLKLIGKGSFGKVYLVQNNLTETFHAMKVIPKKTIVKYNQLNHTLSEKLVLQSTNCPFTIRLQNFFKDNSNIYFIVPFAQGGELYSHLFRFGKFEELIVMFYVAQVILALEYLHFLDILYRDIKPENILIDHTGYLKLADFGFCKRLTKGRTYTLCGTPEYLAPEVILGKGYGKAVDWWGVGILTYELAAGFTPFKGKNALTVYENILRGTYKIPTNFSVDLKDLIRHILQADISKRFGILKNGIDDLKDHKWFRPLSWQAVISRKFRAPYCPPTEGPDDTQYFRSINYESLLISKTELYPEEFKDF